MTRRDRNKNILVAVLAVAALSYTAYTLMSSGRPKAAAANATSSQTSTNKTALATSSATAKGAQAADIIPDKPINLVEVQSKFRKWSESPARDPFLIIAPPRTTKADMLRAADILTLHAVWRQSGDRLAVINNEVLGEGDRIAGYRIEKIDARQVWVRGTNGTELINFQMGAPSAPSDRNKQTPGRRPPSGGATTVERRLPS